MKKLIRFIRPNSLFLFFAFGIISLDCSNSKTDETVAKESNMSNVNPKAKSLAIDFKATDLHGKTFDGLSLKGKIVLLDFWAVWCRPCIAAFPILDRLNKNFKVKGFQVLGIASYSGTVEDVNKFIKKHEIDYSIVVGDEGLVEKFKVMGYPTYFLIHPNGNVYKQYVGEVKDFYQEVKVDILELQKAVK